MTTATLPPSVVAEEDRISAELAEELLELQPPQVRVMCPTCLGEKTRDYGQGPVACPDCAGNGDVLRFAISNREQALYVAKKLKAIEARRADAVGALQKELQAIQALIDRENRRADQRAAFWRDHLIFYHRRLLEVDPRAKTVEVYPGVQLVARKGQDGLDYGDEATLAKFLQEHLPEYARIKVEVEKTALKGAAKVQDDGSVIVATPDGEAIVLPGVRFKPGAVKHDVKVSTDE